MTMTEPGNEPCIWTERVRIHSYDVDFCQRATLEALCRHFLEAAWNHAEALGVGYSHLAAQNKFWVLSRLLLKIAAQPAWGETLLLRTWPRPAKSLFALRDFELEDARGFQNVAGSSAWLVLDRQTRRPQRLTKLLPPGRTFPDRRAAGADPEKLPPLNAGRPGPVIQARYGDIDVNGHVNSTRYLGWLLDSYPLEFHRIHRLDRIEINYLGETRGGDEVSVVSAPVGPDEYLHGIVRAGGEEVGRARTHWVPRG